MTSHRPVTPAPSSSSDSPIVLRLLQAADTPDFRALRVAMLHDTPSAYGASPQDEAGLSDSDWLARIGPDDDTAAIGAYVDDGLIGSAVLARQRPLKMRHKAVIWGVYVDARWRGHGVARRLMTGLIAHARQMPDLHQLTLAVTASNTAAHDLYRSLGFDTYSIAPAGLRVGEQWFDEKQMVLRLD